MIYNPIYKNSQLLIGTGSIVIVTGWTIKESVAKHLDKSDYGVIGQLYSPARGINFLVRNLLANPSVTALMAINATREDLNAGSMTCLRDFFINGFSKGVSDTGKECWIIKSDVKGYIDIEVSEEALIELRQNTRYVEVDSIKSAVTQIKNNNFLPVSNFKRSAKTFPMTEVQPTILPGVTIGHRIEGKTIAETWVKIIQRIKSTGKIRPTAYGGQWQELIDLTAVVTDEPENYYFSDYLPTSKEFINTYVAEFLEDAVNTEGVKYTYGQRLRSHFGVDQIEQVINKLVTDIDSARVVMNLWDTDDYNSNTPPCLNHIWLRVIDSELTLTATFRSNDMFSAWVSNAMGLRALQRHIKEGIEKRSGHRLKLGALITVSQSAHIYDDCWENADSLIENEYVKNNKRQDYYDPCGNFLIEAEDSIVVIQTNPDTGEEVKRYVGTSGLKVLREICLQNPAIKADHAGYLGMELQKAERAIDESKYYEQDKKLHLNP